MIQPHSGIWTVSGPTGAGKTTLNKALLELFRSAAPLMRVTTRKRRPTDIDGEYEYVLPEKFESYREEGCFLRTIKIRDYYHGLPLETLDKALQGGLWVTDLDPKMVEEIAGYATWNHRRNLIRSVYLDLPNEEAMRQRLEQRGESDIEGRVQACRGYHTRVSGLSTSFHTIDACQTPQQVLQQAIKHFTSP